jgi:hypothetical protein
MGADDTSALASSGVGASAQTPAETTGAALRGKQGTREHVPEEQVGRRR